MEVPALGCAPRGVQGHPGPALAPRRGICGAGPSPIALPRHRLELQKYTKKWSRNFPDHPVSPPPPARPFLSCWRGWGWRSPLAQPQRCPCPSPWPLSPAAVAATLELSWRAAPRGEGGQTPPCTFCCAPGKGWHPDGGCANHPLGKAGQGGCATLVPHMNDTGSLGPAVEVTLGLAFAAGAEKL